MKTQELLSNKTTPAAPPAPRVPRNITREQFTLVNERAGPLNVVVKVKPFGSPARPPRMGRIPTLRDVPPSRSSHRWALVLAGGDGVRLKELTRWISGDDRPKQFCPLLENRTLLETTRQRAERCLPADHILFALTRSHEQYYRDLMYPGSKRIIQPSNRGTAPAILYGLLQIARSDRDAIVSILPCDHYYSSETAFAAALETALEIAEQHTGSLVLLGAPPKGPETEYGWIQTGESVERPELFRVQGFREKPTLPVAENLYRNGSLWNMFVMTGHVQAFLDIASSTAPELMRALESHLNTLPVDSQVRIPDRFYDEIAPMDFSSQILASASRRLLALCPRDLEWSDLGDPYRVLVTLVERDGDLPPWAKLWSEPGDESLAAAAGA